MHFNFGHFALLWKPRCPNQLASVSRYRLLGESVQKSICPANGLLLKTLPGNLISQVEVGHHPSFGAIRFSLLPWSILGLRKKPRKVYTLGANAQNHPPLFTNTKFIASIYTQAKSSGNDWPTKASPKHPSTLKAVTPQKHLPLMAKDFIAPSATWAFFATILKVHQFGAKSSNQKRPVLVGALLLPRCFTKTIFTLSTIMKVVPIFLRWILKPEKNCIEFHETKKATGLRLTYGKTASAQKLWLQVAERFAPIA